MSDLLTVLDMAKLLKISRSKAYALTKEKDFPSIKIGTKNEINAVVLKPKRHIVAIINPWNILPESPENILAG